MESNIPFYVMKEHRDAYSIWQNARLDGVLKDGCYLLHIDHHFDNCYGVYGFELNSKPGSKDDVQHNVKKLGIADFISPCINDGLFSIVHYMLDTVPNVLKEKRYVFYTKNDNCLTMLPYSPILDREHDFFTEVQGGFMQKIKIDRPWVLDIDLDYFCVDDTLSTGEKRRLQITEKEFLDFTNNMYHPFRLFDKATWRVYKEEGNYYIEETPNMVPQKISETIIKKRLDNLFSWLSTFDVKPSLIDVCTSEVSGYLNAKYGKYVVDETIKRLTKLYGLSQPVWYHVETV